MTAFWISVKTALCATGIVFFAGLYAARFVYGLKRFRGIIDGLFTLPMVLPPTVVGFFILLAVGKNSPFGRFLLQFQIQLVFSWGATVIASAVVSFPMMYRTVLGSMEQMDRNLIYAGRTLGMSERRIFWTVMIPSCRKGILAGTVLAMARAIGEFGATMMVAGNIPGRTQTLSTAVYTAMQAGDRTSAFRWVLVILALSLPMMGKVNSLNASVAAGALIYEAVRQRQAIGLDGKQEESRRG